MDDEVRIWFHRIIEILVYLLLFFVLLKLTTSRVFGYTELQAQPAEVSLVVRSLQYQFDNQDLVPSPLTGSHNRQLFDGVSDIINPDLWGPPEQYHLSPILFDKGPLDNLDSAERKALERSWWWESWPWIMIIVSSVSLIGYLLVHSKRLVNIGDSFPDA